MRISKHIHSCLLVEEQGKRIIIDPGDYTYKEKGLDINALSRLDFILITHTHPDHMSLPFIKELLAKFPKIKITGNKQVVDVLAGIQISATSEENDFVKMSETNHDEIFDLPQIKNLVFHVFDKLTDPGDTLNINQSKEILAFPIQGLWTSLTLAINRIVELKPKVVIPIHDWHWKEEVRKNAYERAEKFLAKHDIEFKKMETGETIEA